MDKKQYYLTLIEEHKLILAKARKLILTMLDKLDEEIAKPEIAATAEKKSEIKFWWGDKESASSILAKMTALLLKLIPLEMEIAHTDLSKADISELEGLSTQTKVDKDDIKILEQYAERILQAHGVQNLKPTPQ